MVNIVTQEEFEGIKTRIWDLLGDINKRLDGIEKRQDNLKKRMDEYDEDDISAHERIDEIEEKIKSFFTCVKEAFEPVPE